MTGGQLYKLISDRDDNHIFGDHIIIKNLIGSSRFDQFIIDNICTATDLMFNVFKGLTDTEFNNLFNDKQVKVFFMNLSEEEFLQIANCISKNGVKEAFSSQTIQNRIEKLSSLSSINIGEEGYYDVVYTMHGRKVFESVEITSKTELFKKLFYLTGNLDYLLNDNYQINVVEHNRARSQLILKNLSDGLTEVYLKIDGKLEKVTCVVENGNIIVSSWGQKYKYIPTEKTSYVSVLQINFDIE